MQHLEEIEKVRSIRNFPALIKYLRDTLEWPIESEDFEDISFEYTPEELGIDAKTAAKIQDIKQLRPLSGGQPWGIFFVKFEPKRLPIVALRKILARLVVNKRGSSNADDRKPWQMHDLLFISNYGDEEERSITFAHFTDQNEHGDLPTLRVLGWDEKDTTLHLDRVVSELKQNLVWKEGEAVNDWRLRWSKAFKLRPQEVITTSKALASRLAQLAQNIRRRANAAMEIETDRGPLKTLMAGFKSALVHDLNEDRFADMYAQTIAYGLLSARVSRPEGLVADNLADMVPVTNPFLKELMQTFLNVGGRKWNDSKGKLVGIDFDELGVNDVVDTLRQANMEAVLADFGNRNPTEDPVIHFYELFLKEYDAKLRMQRGVFYTPKPVVSYIVRSVHELLRTEFGLPDGLADTTTWGEMLKKHTDLKLPGITVVDPKSRTESKRAIDSNLPFVQILDPATGTATFLVEVIDVIHKTMMDKWTKQKVPELARYQKWNDYVPKNLLPRLHGYELMMAPYAIAHMKVGLKLYETGYTFGSDERARIYLTNALEAPQDFSDTFEQMAAALAHEANAVNDVKRHHRFTVVIGNPPYSALSANLTAQARQLVSRFKFVDGVKLKERGALQLEKNLQDDYVKFLAFAEDRLNETQTGVCGMICNNGFVDNPTLRGLRWSLLSNFREAWILDLHGNVNRGDVDTDGSEDQNVFDIKDAGVAIFLAICGPRTTSASLGVRKADLRGDRQTHKYPFLLTKTVTTHPFEDVLSHSEFYLFRSIGGTSGAEYSTWMKVTEIFPLYSIGMITARDRYVIDHDPDLILQRAVAFRDSTLDDEATCKALGIPLKKGWNVARSRQRIRQMKDLGAFIQPLLYRPFDVRPVFYHESLIWGMAWPVMQHMVGGKNLALITSRMTKGESFQHVLVSNGISEVILLSSKTSNNAFAFPLHLRHSNTSLHKQSNTNISSGFARLISNVGGASTTADEMFQFIYGVLHSPNYRRRYADLLTLDFPRIPIPRGPEIFRALVGLGAELVSLHLLESKRLSQPITIYRGPAEPEVEKASFTNGTVWLDKKQTYGFAGVTDAVWNFHIGGYQVCDKWLKDRKARVLSAEDIAHYQKIVVALSETIRLMNEIDEVVDQHGGWPGAFVTNAKEMKA